MGETPFKLAFGTEVMIPIEVGMSSLRQAYYDNYNNNKELKLALDCLSEVKDDVTQKDGSIPAKNVKVPWSKGKA